MFTESHNQLIFMDPFPFEWAKIFKTKFPKNTTFVIISLHFGNDQSNSKKNAFIGKMAV